MTILEVHGFPLKNNKILESAATITIIRLFATTSSNNTSAAVTAEYASASASRDATFCQQYIDTLTAVSAHCCPYTQVQCRVTIYFFDYK